MPEAAPTLSIIIPAYQEEKRIGTTLVSVLGYLDRCHPASEVLVVCDGCTDNTADVARSHQNQTGCQLRVIEMPRNQGKGAVVKEGMLRAQGEFLFFTDADLSYSPELIDEFLSHLKDGADVAVAQRQKETKYPGIGRRMLAVVSRAVVGNLVTPGIRDTQAGFKAFRRVAAEYLFPRQRLKRFLFDLEILMLARRRGFRIDKIYVPWVDRPGSTVHLYRDACRASLDLALIYWWLLSGQYKP